MQHLLVVVLYCIVQLIDELFGSRFTLPGELACLRNNVVSDRNPCLHQRGAQSTATIGGYCFLDKSSRLAITHRKCEYVDIRHAESDRRAHEHLGTRRRIAMSSGVTRCLGVTIIDRVLRRLYAVRCPVPRRQHDSNPRMLSRSIWAGEGRKSGAGLAAPGAPCRSCGVEFSDAPSDHSSPGE